jgi:hypothetical protein
MAKDILGRYVKQYFDDSGGTPRDLSADLVPNTLSGIGTLYEEVDMTGQNEAVSNFLAGQGQSDIRAEYYMNDTGTTGAFSVLSGMVGEVGTFTAQYGTGGEAQAGDPEWEGEYVLLELTVGVRAGKAVMKARWRPAAGSAAPAWGTVS